MECTHTIRKTESVYYYYYDSMEPDCVSIGGYVAILVIF